MNNPFEVGDMVTVDLPLTQYQALVTVDVTPDKAYELVHVGIWMNDIHAPEDVTFIDDVGDKVTLNCMHVTFVNTGE